MGELGLSLPETRNPFKGKGLRVSLLLLLEPEPWAIRELAEVAGASPALVSMVVAELRKLELLDGDVRQGRRASVQGTRRLCRQVALNWPRPDAGVQGRRPEGAPIGGGPAHAAAGLVSHSPPRVYASSRREAHRLLAEWGGAFVAPEVADYELSVLDLPIGPGLVPPVVVALELGGTPRGQETLLAHEDALMAGLPE